MKKNANNQNNQEQTNVIDMTARMQEPETVERLKSLKTRFDLEHAKIALSTSLLSVVVLVTLANKNLMTSDAEPVQASRGIASVPTGTSDAEDNLVKTLAQRELSSQALGRKPSSLESLAFGTLEGKYAIRLEHGKLAELEFSQAQDSLETDRPKMIQNRGEFIEAHRDLMPVMYDKSVWTDRKEANGATIETYKLVNEVSRPVGTIEFKLDSAGRMLSMKAASLHMATAASN